MNKEIKDDRPVELADSTLRKTSQYLMPSNLDASLVNSGEYDVYPFCSLGHGKISTGYASMARWIAQQKTVVIDGYEGVFFDHIKDELNTLLVSEGLRINWVNTSKFLKEPEKVQQMVAPFLGEYESVWGTKCTLTLKDLFAVELLEAQVPDKRSDINIIIGPGAALANWDAALVYIDLPKNELQFRMRAGSVYNLGAAETNQPFQMYKRFYFVDWVLLNNHKKALLNKITVVADGQWLDTINWMFKSDLAEGMNKISQSSIRVRPWFEPGAWGGQWIKDHIKNINSDVVNYAWSFELIVPENGLVFESDGNLLEVSFDTLMFQNQKQILGKHADIFGDEFPIRFDFLDTVEGGNLSVQCHPTLKYIQENFGENITQDETYYILDCDENAKVYLGFQEDIDPVTFRAALEESQSAGKEIDIEQYVQAIPAKKHDLFLIPNGTVHSAGAGNLVLEISATPYIFTFKMYDWVRLDLEGNPRPINIDHAFNNLDFKRKGSQVAKELISKQSVIEQEADWQIVHVPTHADHFYDVHRIEFDTEVTIATDNCCHILMLVEGFAINIETADGSLKEYAYAETVVIPAAAGSYKLTNLGSNRAKVVKAFLK
jgi:mannose-6-phosphate isomerase class I